MALSIKNDRAERLARQLAKETGESLTLAVLRSLEERLEKLKGRRTAPDLVETAMNPWRCGQVENARYALLFNSRFRLATPHGTD